jgi:predicted lipoprotein with Yx(FWY)xxD motif
MIFPVNAATRRAGLARPMPVIVLFGLAILVSACSSSSSSPPPSTTTGGANSPHGSSGAATVAVASRNSFGTILVDGQGRTLYRYTPDSPGVSTCTGGCAATWPPLALAAGITSPVASSEVSGLGTITRSDGSVQVTYKGTPLYRFTGDSSTTDANGQGFEGKWYVLTVSASSSGTSSTTRAPTTTTPTTTPTSGGNGY